MEVYDPPRRSVKQPVGTGTNQKPTDRRHNKRTQKSACVVCHGEPWGEGGAWYRAGTLAQRASKCGSAARLVLKPIQLVLRGATCCGKRAWCSTCLQEYSLTRNAAGVRRNQINQHTSAQHQYIYSVAKSLEGNITSNEIVARFCLRQSLEVCQDGALLLRRHRRNADALYGCVCIPASPPVCRTLLGAPEENAQQTCHAMFELTA